MNLKLDGINEPVCIKGLSDDRLSARCGWPQIISQCLHVHQTLIARNQYVLEDW